MEEWIPYLEVIVFVNSARLGAFLFVCFKHCFSMKSSNFPNNSTENLLLIMVAQKVKCLPAMQETQVQSLGREDTLEKEMAIHSGTLAWKIPWTEEPGRLQSMGLQRVGHN